MFSHPPADYRNGQMQQRLEIDGFFLVANTQLAVIVHPGMRSLHHPAPRAPFGFVPCLRPSFLGDVRDIASLPHLLLGGFARVALIHTEILGPTLRRFRPWDYDRVQRLGQQLHVVPIGPGDDKRERGATTVHQQTALGSFFSPDRLGCFPPPLAPRELCLESRPSFAIPRQSPPCRRTPPTQLATAARRILPAATAESNGEWHWRCQSSWAVPSTGSRCEAHRRWQRKSRAAKSVCAPRPAAVGTCVLAPCEDCAEARAVRRATRAHRRLPKIVLLAWSNHGRRGKKVNRYLRISSKKRKAEYTRPGCVATPRAGKLK